MNDLCTKYVKKLYYLLNFYNHKTAVKRKIINEEKDVLKNVNSVEIKKKDENH